MDPLQQLAQIVSQQIVLPPEVEEDFLAAWEPISLSKGAHLTQAGEVEHYLYFVVEGIQRGYHLRNGKEVTIAFSYAPGFSGIPESFLTGKPAQYYLQVLSKSTFLRIPRERLEVLFEQHPVLEKWGRLIAEQVLVGVLERQFELMAYSAEERFQVFMRRSSHLLQRVAQKHLASYLNMQPETFSRLLGKSSW